MIYQKLYEAAIYPVYHWLMKDGANAAIRELKRSECLDREALRQVTLSKLQKLLVHARANVPFYKGRLADVNLTGAPSECWESFQHVPLLSKADINENLESMISTDMQGNGLDNNTTSGSTGEKLIFYTDWRSGAFRRATVRRSQRWLGVLPGEPEVRLWGSPTDVERTRTLRGNLHTLISREKMLSAYAMDDESLAEYLAFCRKFKPRLLIGYPSALAIFAAYLEQQGADIPSLRAISCSAETLYEHDRKYLESTFGAPVFNRYGCREVGDIANEAPGVDGLIVNSDRLLVEILAENGEPCGPGEQGEVVVTDLENYGMPLIRYRMGDLAKWAAGSARGYDKYPFPVLESVDGRTLDIVRAPNGNRIGGTYWTILLKTRPGIRKLQVVQDRIDRIRILYVGEEGVTPDFDYFRAKIAERCGPDLQVEFVETEAFEQPPGTKFRLILSKVSAAEASEA
jgi:phenylacetate-CoA ligase